MRRKERASERVKDVNGGMIARVRACVQDTGCGVHVTIALYARPARCRRGLYRFECLFLSRIPRNPRGPRSCASRYLPSRNLHGAKSRRNVAALRVQLQVRIRRALDPPPKLLRSGRIRARARASMYVLRAPEVNAPPWLKQTASRVAGALLV